jgi:hypothetical protein
VEDSTPVAMEEEPQNTDKKITQSMEVESVDVIS